MEVKVSSGLYLLEGQPELREDSGEFFVRARCRDRIAGYLLCFSKYPDPPLASIRNELQEGQFSRLPDRFPKDFDAYQLQYAPKSLFETKEVFRLPHVSQPEFIWIWTVWEDALGRNRVIYVPPSSSQQRVVIGLCVQLQMKRVGNQQYIRVSLPDQAAYSHGTLLYKVGNQLPIPIPGEWIGREIKVCLEMQEKVQIIVNESLPEGYARIVEVPWQY